MTPAAAIEILNDLLSVAKYPDYRAALSAGIEALTAQKNIETVGEVVYFGGDGDLKEVSWKKGRLPPVGTALLAQLSKDPQP